MGRGAEMFSYKQSTKYWLIGSLFILVINGIIFLFRKHFDLTILVWVVILTPVAWLILYFLTDLLDKDDPHRKNQRS